MFRTQTSERCSRPYGVARISSFPQNGWKTLYHCRRPEHLHLHSQAENKVTNNWIHLTGVNTFYTSLSLSLHFAVPVSTLRCPCLYTSLSLSLHFPVIVSTLPCHCLYTSLSLSLHFTVPVSTLHCPCLYTSLSLSLHFTVLVSTLHCSIYLAVPGSTHPNDREH